MFLCGKCHDNEKFPHSFKSRGACEVCGRLANCVDCKDVSHDKPPPKKVK